MQVFVICIEIIEILGLILASNQKSDIFFLQNLLSGNYSFDDREANHFFFPKQIMNSDGDYQLVIEEHGCRKIELRVQILPGGHQLLAHAKLSLRTENVHTDVELGNLVI